jgi:hypothetical protein
LPLSEGMQGDACYERAEVHAGFRDTEREQAHLGPCTARRSTIVHDIDREFRDA